MLEQLQIRLERHFRVLADMRQAYGLPTFVLEHGLNSFEIAELQEHIKIQLIQGRLGSAWLPWVVYAAEQGYDYDGHEYWESFSKRTPGWDTYGDRQQIRNWFKRFHKEFYGVSPTGIWAERFNIIAWPITHAILPKDLQYQLAHSLYHFRYHLKSIKHLNAISIGSLLAQAIHYPTSRYRNFLEQKELVGRVVLSILQYEEDAPSIYLDVSLVKRLLKDIENVQNASEWLNETKNLLKTRDHALLRDPFESDSKLPVTANVSLSLIKTPKQTWNVLLTVKGVLEAAEANSTLQSFLQSTRCAINISNLSWVPATWLLASAAKRVIQSWPCHDEDIILIEKANELLKFKSSFSFTKNFHVFELLEDDDVAYIVEEDISPGGCYIVLATSPISNEELVNFEIECAGVYGYKLSIPEAPSSLQIANYQSIGLKLKNRIRIEVLGEVVALAENKGIDVKSSQETYITIQAEWLAECYSVRLDNSPPTTIFVDASNSPVFVKIPPLPIGPHLLSISVDAVNNTLGEDFQSKYILRSHLPLAKAGASQSLGPLYVHTEPYKASLDDLWSGNFQLSTYGLDEFEIEASISIGDQSELIGTFSLPITTEEWLKRFRAFKKGIQSNKQKDWLFSSAHLASLKLEGGVVGNYNLNLEREIKPLRWLTKQNEDQMFASIINESHSSVVETLSLYTFEQPAKASEFNVKESVYVEIKPPGGLLKASLEDMQDSLIVSTTPSDLVFAEFFVNSDFSSMSIQTLAEDFKILSLWNKSSIIGPLGDLRRDRVIKGMILKVFDILCGEDWARLELEFFKNSKIDMLEKAVGGPASFAFSLIRKSPSNINDIESTVTWFLELASENNICFDYNTCELALRISASPQDVSEYFDLNSFIVSSKAETIKVLLRGARLFALAQTLEKDKIFEGVVPQWNW